MVVADVDRAAAGMILLQRSLVLLPISVDVLRLFTPEPAQ